MVWTQLCMIKHSWLCMFFLTSGLGLTIPGQNHRNSKEIYIDVTEIAGRERRSPNDDDMPTELKIQLDVNDVTTSLALKRNFDVNVNVPITVQRNVDGKTIIIRESIRNVDNIGVYTSRESGASFLVDVTRRGNPDYPYEFFGTFFAEQEEYMVQPSNGSHDKHVIEKVSRDPGLYGDWIEPSDSVPKWRGSKEGVQFRHKRNTAYSVEILFVIDYSIYSFWYDQSPEATASEKDLDAKQKIRQFYSFVLNAVNLRYMSVTGSGYTMNVLFAGIHIADTVSASSWTETTAKNMSTTPPQVDASFALDLFKTWVNGQSGLPDHDHAMLFTKYDLQDKGNPGIAGLAYTNTTCTTSSQSICEDHFGSYINTVAAHELGHSLSAAHDGFGNTCSGDDGYVMAAVGRLSDTDLAKNRRQFEFSSCSLDKFDDYITSLNNGDNNCLTSTGASYNATALSEFSSDLAGQTYPPDSQCLNSKGTGSFFCRSFYDEDFSTICSKFYCSTSSTSCSLALAWEGTTCGNGKVCSSGLCVTSPRAPAVSDSCPFGDQPETVASTGQTCTELIAASSVNCYNYGEHCCASCEAYRTNVTGCLYGDKATGCATLTSTGCYAGSNADTCCGLCGAAATGVTGCEYGDKAPWCSTLPAYQCYRNGDTCCAKCPTFHTRVTGCEYGDRQASCDAAGCSDATYAYYCCGTCAPPTTTAATTAATTTGAVSFTEATSSTTPLSQITQSSEAATPFSLGSLSKITDIVIVLFLNVLLLHWYM